MGRPLKKYIHVNQKNIRKNIHNGKDLPVITVKTYKENLYGHTVEIDGPSEVVYPKNTLSCGARVWMETHSSVKVFDRDGKLVGTL